MVVVRNFVVAAIFVTEMVIDLHYSPEHLVVLCWALEAVVADQWGKLELAFPSHLPA